MIFQFFKKVLIFLILLVAISCQNPQILTRISNEKQLKDIMTKNVKAAIIYIYSPTNQCDNCQKIIESLANNLDGIIDSYSIFCDKFDQTTHNLEICINYYNKIIELPEVSLIEPNQDQSYKKHIIRIQDLDFKLLKTLVSKLSPLYSKSLNTFSDLENFLNDSKHNFNKVLYFYKNQEIPLIFKGLTSLYIDRLQVF